MEVSSAIDLGRDALLVALIIAGPILAAGLVVGLGISIVQAVTQIHDQTFALIPKIVVMIAAAVVFVPWAANRLLEYSQTLFAGG